MSDGWFCLSRVGWLVGCFTQLCTEHNGRQQGLLWRFRYSAMFRNCQHVQIDVTSRGCAKRTYLVVSCNNDVLIILAPYRAPCRTANCYLTGFSQLRVDILKISLNRSLNGGSVFYCERPTAQRPGCVPFCISLFHITSISIHLLVAQSWFV
jgi:hypothetical protein